MPAYKQLLQVLEYVVKDSESAEKFNCKGLSCSNCIFNMEDMSTCVLIHKEITEETIKGFLYNYVQISEKEENQDKEKFVDIPF